jgi:xylulokinase
VVGRRFAGPMNGQPDDRFVLAVDLGTGGPKIGLVSLAGRIASKEHVLIATTYPGRGAAIQDANLWWDVIVECARRQLHTGEVQPDQVVAICCTGQWSSTVPVDEFGCPVGECVMWMDTRGRCHIQSTIGGRFGGYSIGAAIEWARLTGRLPDSDGADPLGHMLHLERDREDISNRTRWYLEPVDYLTMRFSGVASASPASMLATYLIDTRHPGSLEYDQRLITRIGLPASKLPPLRPTGSVVGNLSSSSAAALGLDEGVKVIAGVPDLHSATIGSGSAGDYEGHLAISTTSWLSAPVPFRKTRPFSQIASVAGIRENGYLAIDTQAAAGACLAWLRDSLLVPNDGMHSHQDVSFVAMTELAAGVPAGSGKVLFSPWLMGQRTPKNDEYARAGFHNLTLRTKRANLVRAVLEGVAFSNRWLLESVERFVGRRLDNIRIIGGGARSDLWCQIHADVCNREFERTADPVHASLRGAGLLAGLALEAISPDEVRELVPVDRRFVPTATNLEIYDGLFSELASLGTSHKSALRRLNGRRST